LVRIVPLSSITTPVPTAVYFSWKPSSIPSPSGSSTGASSPSAVVGGVCSAFGS
jgi:hypothetical protein